MIRHKHTLPNHVMPCHAMPAMPWLRKARRDEQARTRVGKGVVSTPSQTLPFGRALFLKLALFLINHVSGVANMYTH